MYTRTRDGGQPRVGVSSSTEAQIARLHPDTGCIFGPRLTLVDVVVVLSCLFTREKRACYIVLPMIGWQVRSSVLRTSGKCGGQTEGTGGIRYSTFLLSNMFWEGTLFGRNTTATK